MNTAFRGCIYSFKVNNQHQPLEDDRESAIFQVAQINDGGSAASGVMRGCDGADVCASNPCSQELYCNDIW